jgi:hypothetical protein
MSQYGAKGLADKGKTYEEILATYYTGLHPSHWHGSRSMRVGVLQGAGAAAVSGNGTFGVYTGEDPLSASTIGVWSVSMLGAHSLAVSPPTGYTLPLVLSGMTAPRSLFVDPPRQGGSLDVDFVVPKAAEVTGILRRGAHVVARGRTVVEAGEGRVNLTIDTNGLPQRATYRLEVAAYDGTTRVVKTADVVLTRPAPSLLPISAIVALVALGFIVLIARRRRRRVVQSAAIPERGQLSPEPHG